MADIEIKTLGQLTEPQIRAVIEKATIEAVGQCTPPPLDLEAIKERADDLDPKSQTKADIYLLLIEVRNLNTQLLKRNT